MPSLFDSLKIGELQLPNRVIMAPLTRLYGRRRQTDESVGEPGAAARRQLRAGCYRPGSVMSAPFAMFALDEPVDARTPPAYGLANQVVPLSELRPRPHRAAETLAKRPAGAINHTKALMHEIDRTLGQMNRERASFVERLRSAEAREAFEAFAERRQPNFSKVAG
jgi:enoyl-CoA hydratase/carnithine racemase